MTGAAAVEAILISQAGQGGTANTTSTSLVVNNKAEARENLPSDLTETPSPDVSVTYGLSTSPASHPSDLIDGMDGPATDSPMDVAGMPLLYQEGYQSSLTPEQHEEIFLLKPLAKQLEYYFSQHNLSKDTYLRTLRDLNDGCVPATILANFAKVRALFMPLFVAGPATQADEHTRTEAVLRAARDYTDLLEVYAIDTATGKKVQTIQRSASGGAIVDQERKGQDSLSSDMATDACTTPPSLTTSTTTIWAVGPITQEPLAIVPPLSPNGTTLLTSVSSQSVSNTIILREVPPMVTEDEVRHMFEALYECPAIVSIHCDVAHCWFVTLDTDDRNDMIRVMMQLRMATLGDEIVLARLKASTTAPSICPSIPTVPSMYPTPEEVLAMVTSTSLMMKSMMMMNDEGAGMSALGKKKKKKNRPKRKKNRSAPNLTTLALQDGSDSRGGKIASGSSASSSLASGQRGSGKAQMIPPSFDDADFPTLQDKHVEWESKVVNVRGNEERRRNNDDEDDEDDDEDDDDADEDDDIEEGESMKSIKAMSDAASTATTTSSSLESIPKKTLGGYAAALLKPSTVGKESSLTAIMSVAPAATSSASAAAAAASIRKSASAISLPRAPIQEEQQRPLQGSRSTSNLGATERDKNRNNPDPSSSDVVITPLPWGSGLSFADILRRSAKPEATRSS